MNIKSICVALFIAACATSGIAAVPRPTEFTATFIPDGTKPGTFELTGFGRADRPAAARQGAQTAAVGDLTPFHDRWFLDGLLAGDYPFSTLIATDGALNFSFVSLSWLTADGPEFIDFDVNADGTLATGSGVFSMLTDNCKKCVWLDIYGLEDVNSARGYGGPFTSSPVPEPQAYGLMLVGLAGLMVARRRRQS
jgi:hypothetical protein